MGMMLTHSLYTKTDTPVVDFDITPLGVNLMEVPYIATILQKMVIQLLHLDWASYV